MISDFGVELLLRHWAAFVDLGYVSVHISPSIFTYWTTGIDGYLIFVPLIRYDTYNKFYIAIFVLIRAIY